MLFRVLYGWKFLSVRCFYFNSLWNCSKITKLMRGAYNFVILGKGGFKIELEGVKSLVGTVSTHYCLSQNFIFKFSLIDLPLWIILRFKMSRAPKINHLKSPINEESTRRKQISNNFEQWRPAGNIQKIVGWNYFPEFY